MTEAKLRKYFGHERREYYILIIGAGFGTVLLFTGQVGAQGAMIISLFYYLAFSGGEK